MDNRNINSGGVSFFGLLTILFIGLKLTGNINWSWWVVLSPSLAPIGITLVVVLGFGFYVLTAGALRWLKYKLQEVLLDEKNNN